MIMNMDGESNQNRFAPEGGIGLYKINYEMDVKGSSDKPQYIAGIVAYSNDEAIQTLIGFCQKRVKGFKGLKVQELAFEGLCHEISDQVRNVILGNAIREGKVVATKAHRAVLAELESNLKKTAKTKRTIVKNKE